jgi:hypothetical protein
MGRKPKSTRSLLVRIAQIGESALDEIRARKADQVHGLIVAS